MKLNIGLLALIISATVLSTGCGTDKNRLNDSISDGSFVEVVSENGVVYNIKRGPRHNDRIHSDFHERYAEFFNDSNYRHYALAEKFGITPISGVGDAYFTDKPIVKIATNEYYFVEELTHSMPYLVPSAARLLEDIGRSFIDSLGRRGADGYRIRVTSVLRTPQSVKSLRRINRNATDSSTHKFATTFDISWVNFNCLDSTRTIHSDDLKKVLSEVLRDMRNQGRCLVKYERKSPCYHITVAE